MGKADEKRALVREALAERRHRRRAPHASRIWRARYRKARDLPFLRVRTGFIGVDLAHGRDWTVWTVLPRNINATVSSHAEWEEESLPHAVRYG